MSFRVHQSNRLERLAEVLADCCRAPLHSAFAAESIVVPNAGMQRWLSLRLAERLGICANVRFALPAAFAWDVWKRVLDDVPDAAAFSAPVLAWRIFGALEEAAGNLIRRATRVCRRPDSPTPRHGFRSSGSSTATGTSTESP